MSLGIFYGTTTGNTGDIAVLVQEFFGTEEASVFDVKDTSLAAVSDFDQLIFAIPTWDYGEVQEDWLDIWQELDGLDMSGKTVALIGLGDQYGYAEWFVDAMGMLHDKLVAAGAAVVGHWPVDGYEYDESKAETSDGRHFVGLALDEDNQHESTRERLSEWCSQVMVEFAVAC
ncbi:flavodoxin FldB [Marinobacterium jannaschii]|uniref:flavodoxin FldB n=1 Tax=Marinobacterium jannaschii TaxID=64970 RepID=UPI0004815EEE|nr:flavodoxin FldB [Marinobacterium jannaschii]